MTLVLVLSCGVARAARGDAVYTRPGRLIGAGNGVRLNFYCMGKGSPTVIFDAGWEDWSPSWVLIQPVIARYTRTCTYDRAGSGFSTAGPMPRTSVEIARELHAALHAGGIAGPYLLVGHSFGSYNIRAFADLYMPEVYGMALVDGESGDLVSAKEEAQNRQTFTKTVAGLAACRSAVAAHRPLPSIPAMGHSYTPPPHEPCSHQFFRGLPMPEWSAQLNAVVLHIASSRVPLYDAVISEMQQMPADARWLVAHRRSFGDRPIVVLTAQNHSYDTARTPLALHRAHLRVEQQRAQTQRKYLLLSTDAKQIFAMNSGHYIQLDDPQLVIIAIRSELRL